MASVQVKNVQKFEVIISNLAKNRIKEITLNKPSDYKLRIILSSGGCSGFNVEFKLDTLINDDDIIFDDEGAKVIVDTTTLELINGATLNFTNTLIGSKFKLEVPTATEKCTCGSSFSV